MINHLQQTEVTYTRAEVKVIMGVQSRSTLTTYCNFLRIPRRIRQFSEQQYQEIMALRRWVKEGNAMSDFCLDSENLDRYA
jgi:hypothetical protein